MSNIQNQEVNPAASRLSVAQAVAQFLSYQDAPLESDQKSSILKRTLANASAQKYGAALIEMFVTHAKPAVELQASVLRSEFDREMGKLGLEPLPYSLSTTWALWDMAKQYHFTTHPNETTAPYQPRNPMTSAETRQDIVNRHLGWEVYANLQAGVLGEANFQFHPPHVRDRILKLAAEEPKASSGTLSSWKLTELGSLVRQAMIS